MCRTRIATAAVTLLVAACATTGDGQGNPPAGAPRSLALQVALSAHLTDPRKGPLFDVPRAELPAAPRGRPIEPLSDRVPPTGLDLAEGALDLGGAAWVFDRMDWETPIVGVALLTPLEMFSKSSPHPAARPQVIAWMPPRPDDSRSSQEAARARLEDILKSAVIAALPQGAGVETRTAQIRRSPSRPSVRKEYTAVTGLPGCEAPVECRLTAKAGLPSIAVAPEYTGPLHGHEIWHWHNAPPGARKGEWSHAVEFPRLVSAQVGDFKHETEIEWWRDRPFVGRLSAHLPEWYYVYLPSGENLPPVVLHRGQAHYFIEPAAGLGTGPARAGKSQ